MGAMKREVQQAIHPGLLRMAARGLVGPLAPIMGKSKGFRHVPWARGAVDVSPLDPSAGPRSRRWCLISPRAAGEVRVRGARRASGGHASEVSCDRRVGRGEDDEKLGARMTGRQSRTGSALLEAWRARVGGGRRAAFPCWVGWMWVCCWDPARGFGRLLAV